MTPPRPTCPSAHTKASPSSGVGAASPASTVRAEQRLVSTVAPFPYTSKKNKARDPGRPTECHRIQHDILRVDRNTQRCRRCGKRRWRKSTLGKNGQPLTGWNAWKRP